MVLGIRGLIKLERIEQLGLTAISFTTEPIFAIVPRELINSGAWLCLRTFIRGRYDYEVELQSRYD